MLLNCGIEEDSWESLGLQGDPTSPSQRKLVLNIQWKVWCWSWTSILWPPDVKNWLIGKDPDVGKDWRQEEKRVTEEEMVEWTQQTQWTWVWVSSGSCWWTRRPGVLQSMGLLRVRHDKATELNWWWYQFSAWDYKLELHKLQFEVLSLGLYTAWKLFPIETPDCCYLGLPSTVWIWILAQCGDVYAITLLYSFYFSSWFSIENKLDNSLLDIKIVYLYVMNGFFC